MGRVTVVGGTLPGLALAARLAKVGHDVTLLEPSGTLGGRHADPLAWPATIDLPAAWRDLFTKSGRPLDATLATRGLALAPAPPAVHLMPDGKQLRLPTDRGAQTSMVRLAYGDRWAQAWQDHVDAQVDVWQRLRPLGLEADEPLDRARWRALEPRRSLADVAATLGPLAPLVTQLAWPYEPADVPAWVAVQPWVDRTFGRWQLIADASGKAVQSTRAASAETTRQHPQLPASPIADLPPSDERPAHTHPHAHALSTATPAAVDPTVLVDLLVERVRRRVDVRLDTPVDVRALRRDPAAGTAVDTRDPWTAGRPPRGLRPALVPAVSTEPADRPLPEVVDHAARTIAHSVVLDGQLVRVTQDFAHPHEDPRAGTAWAGARSWRRRPPLTSRDGVVRTSAASRAGAAPWQQLLGGAVASYLAHDLAGGDSIRPVDDPRQQQP